MSLNTNQVKMVFMFNLWWSNVVLGDARVVVTGGLRLQHLLIGISIGSTWLTLQVSTVPASELILVDFAHWWDHIALRVVGPHLANVQILNELHRVATPELLCRNESTGWDDATRGELGACLDAGALKHDTLFPYDHIILNVARVKCASSSDRTILAYYYGGWHACRQGSSRVNDTVVSNGREPVNRDAINVTPDDSIVPYGGILFNMTLTDNCGVRSDPAILNSWE